MPTDEKKWGHVRLKWEIWQKMLKLAAKSHRTLTAEVNLALEKYKPKQ